MLATVTSVLADSSVTKTDPMTSSIKCKKMTEQGDEGDCSAVAVRKEKESKVPDTPPIIRLPCCPLPYTSIKIQTMSPDKIEVIRDTERCKVLVAKLRREKLVAMAAEGINVGREGPLTLLQLGTCSGYVYIFDILENRDLMLVGRLRQLLEDVDIIKVVHDVSNVSAALYFQFATSLANVFDTQVAHHLIEEHQGRRLPAGMKLSDICLQYTDDTDKMHTYDWRTDSKQVWMAMVGNFWAMRPLTPDMIEFAAGDVIVLIPDVYRHQKEYIESHGLREKMRQRVDDWLQLEIDEVIKESHGKRVSRIVHEILTSMDKKYDDRATLFNILDSDDMNALSLATYEDAELVSKKILKLKIAHIMADLGDIELKMRSDAESWEKRPHVLTHLRYYMQMPDEQIRMEAEKILSELIQYVLEHVDKKYSLDTLPNMLSDTERDALLSIPYTDIHTGSYGDVVVELYWKFMQGEIHEQINLLRLVPSEFSLTDYEYKKLEYFVQQLNIVPEEVSSLAAGLLHAVCAYSAASGCYVITERRKARELVCN